MRIIVLRRISSSSSNRIEGKGELLRVRIWYRILSRMKRRSEGSRIMREWRLTYQMHTLWLRVSILLYLFNNREEVGIGEKWNPEEKGKGK